MSLTGFLRTLEKHVAAELSEMPPVNSAGPGFDVEDLPVEGRTWTQLDQVYAVVADLKDSTRLGIRKHAASTASIYEAGVGGVVRVLDGFGANDLAIQGDGAFGVFWGEGAFGRAMTAGITIKTFSERYFEVEIERKWPDAPKTGFKVGIAASPILVKRVGLQRDERYEEVWAGKAVNYATKAAQSADRRQLVVSGFVWDAVEANDYLAFSCGCHGGPSTSIWSDITIRGLPEGDSDRFGRVLRACWCRVHGDDFCAAVLSGRTRRADVNAIRGEHTKRMMNDAVLAKARRDRENRRRLAGVR